MQVPRAPFPSLPAGITFALAGSLVCAQVIPANSAAVVDTYVLQIHLMEYKMDARHLCGRLLEHYDPETLRRLVFPSGDTNGPVTPGPRARWVEDLAAALGQKPPSSVRVIQDESGNSAVAIRWYGGGDTWSGVSIGRRGYRLTDVGVFAIQCAPGIYVWRESRTPRRRTE